MEENNQHALIVPAFKTLNEIRLTLNYTRVGESRLLEAKSVSPINYSDLESCFNQAYRELKTNLAIVGDQINKADVLVEKAKSDFLIDRYQEKIKDLPKSYDSADLRKAWLMRDIDYTSAKDRLDMLKAMEALLDGKIKVFERTCAFMKKQMDLLLRSGLSGSQLYITNKGKE